MFRADHYYNKSRESLEAIPPDEFIDLLEPKLEYVLSLEGLAGRLQDEAKLRVKLGIDPTGPDVHIGHIVPVRVLDLFNRAGHHIDLIFGDFTAKIGDPAGRSDGRKALSDEEIASNVATYEDQVRNFFDTNRPNVTIHKNSQWLGELALPEVFEYLQMTNLSEAMQRKDFRARMESGAAVSLAEAMYGTLQGIDSVHLHSDVEIGGIDQLLNVQQARAVQRRRSQTPEEILLTPIIEGTNGDGRKMSKSYDNYVPATAEPDEIFGKIMSIPDTHTMPYIVAFAPIRQQDIEALKHDSKTDPLELKKQLATYMVATASGGLEAGLQARETFERRFSRREVNEDDAVEVLASSGDTILNVLIKTGQFQSNGAVRRLVRGGAIKVNGAKITEDKLAEQATNGSIISAGKRKHFKVEHREDS